LNLFRAPFPPPSLRFLCLTSWQTARIAIPRLSRFLSVLYPFPLFSERSYTFLPGGALRRHPPPRLASMLSSDSNQNPDRQSPPFSPYPPLAGVRLPPFFLEPRADFPTNTSSWLLSSVGSDPSLPFHPSSIREWTFLRSFFFPSP